MGRSTEMALVNGRVLRDDGFVDGLAVLHRRGPHRGRRAAQTIRASTPPWRTTSAAQLLHARLHRHPGQRRRRRAVQRRADRRVDPRHRRARTGASAPPASCPR